MIALVVLLCLCFLGSAEESQAKKIVGGRPVYQSEYDRAFPFLVQSSSTWSMWCTCSLISSRWILTAAHCVDDQVNTIRIGSPYPMQGRAYNIVRQISHPSFSWWTLLNDVALIQVDRDVTGTFAQIAGVNWFHSLPTLNGQEMTMVGWGAAGAERPPPDILHTAQTRHNPNCRFTGDICVQGFNGTGACFGDSGGPLLFQGIQIGVVSRGDFNPPPICENGIVMYASTEFHGSWIRSQLTLYTDEDVKPDAPVLADLNEACMTDKQIKMLQNDIPILETALTATIRNLELQLSGDLPEGYGNFLMMTMEHLSLVEHDLIAHLQDLQVEPCPLCSQVSSHFDQVVNDLVVWMSSKVPTWETDPYLSSVSLFLSQVRTVASGVCA